MKWTLKWHWCVEMRIPSSARARWQVMYGNWHADRLVDITRAEAIERAAKLTRRGGRYAFRVRPLRPVPAS